MSRDATPPGSASSNLELLLTPVRSETLPPYTSVYGSNSVRRKWSGEGEGQGEQYHQKQLAFQQEMLPRFLKLKMF